MNVPEQPPKTLPALVDEAMVDDFIDMPEENLREEIAERGEEPETVIARVRTALAGAEADCARRRMDAARAGVAAWKTRSDRIVPFSDRDRQRGRLADMLAGVPATSGMTMAARKSQGLSERDEEGLLEDLADLERLEEEDDKRGQ